MRARYPGPTAAMRAPREGTAASRAPTLRSTGRPTTGTGVEISTGTVIGGYVVREQLGAGGMGSVYLVRHPTLPRDVALKVLHAGLSATPAMRARFEREAELLSRLSHPNVVDVLDRGQQGDLLWMAMQYVPGPDLAIVLERSGALPPERALDVVAAIGNALDHAHACGLLHRDVKPANILLAAMPGGGERVMLTDFGIGRDMTTSSALTQDGEVVASFAYAAPEQVTGAAIDGRADVYSLGAVLFELLTGRRAFDADSLPALLYAVVHAPPPDVRVLRPDLPPAVGGLLARALAKEPADRFRSCADLVSAARACWPARVPAPSGRARCLHLLTGRPLRTVPGEAGWWPRAPGCSWSPSVSSSCSWRRGAVTPTTPGTVRPRPVPPGRHAPAASRTGARSSSWSTTSRACCPRRLRTRDGAVAPARRR